LDNEIRALSLPQVCVEERRVAGVQLRERLIASDGSPSLNRVPSRKKRAKTGLTEERNSCEYERTTIKRTEART